MTFDMEYVWCAVDVFRDPEFDWDLYWLGIELEWDE